MDEKLPSYANLLVDWGLALDCAGQPQPALAKLQEAAATEPTAHVYTQIAMVYAKQSLWDQAMAALATAEKIDPKFPTTYAYRRGIVLHGQSNRLCRSRSGVLRKRRG